jgi:hypothetical protein
MSLLALPNELLLLIAEHVQTEKKLYFWLRANRRLWAANRGKLSTAQRALDHGTSLNTPVAFRWHFGRKDMRQEMAPLARAAENGR